MKTQDFLVEMTTEVVMSSEIEVVRGHAVESEETEGPLIVVGGEVEKGGQRDAEVVVGTEREKVGGIEEVLSQFIVSFSPDDNCKLGLW